MKTLLALIALVGLAIALLRTDYLPWRILTREEVDTLTGATAMRARAPRPQPSLSDGSWMRDPNRKSRLDPPTPTPHSNDQRWIPH